MISCHQRQEKEGGKAAADCPSYSTGKEYRLTSIGRTDGANLLLPCLRTYISATAVFGVNEIFHPSADDGIKVSLCCVAFFPGEWLWRALPTRLPLGGVWLF